MKYEPQQVRLASLVAYGGRRTSHSVSPRSFCIYDSSSFAQINFGRPSRGLITYLPLRESPGKDHVVGWWTTPLRWPTLLASLCAHLWTISSFSSSFLSYYMVDSLRSVLASTLTTFRTDHQRTRLVIRKEGHLFWRCTEHGAGCSEMNGSLRKREDSCTSMTSSLCP